MEHFRVQSCNQVHPVTIYHSSIGTAGYNQKHLVQPSTTIVVCMWSHICLCGGYIVGARMYATPKNPHRLVKLDTLFLSSGFVLGSHIIVVAFSEALKK